MTSAEGTALAAEVVAVIDEVGIDATYHVDTSAYALSSGNTTPSDTEYDVRVSPPGRVSRALVDGSTILVTDLTVYLAASGITFTPNPGDEIEIEGMTLQVIFPDPLYNIGGGIVAWRLVCRS